MKTTLGIAALIATVAASGWLLNTQQAAAAPPSLAGVGMPPLGKLVEVTLVAWPLSTQAAGRIQGTLVSMQTDWIVVQEGNADQWIPREKVLAMKASR